MIFPLLFSLLLTAFFVYLYFQITTINRSWRELSRSYTLRKKYAWKKWPNQTIYIVSLKGRLNSLRTAMLRKNVTVAVSEGGLGLFVSPYVRLETTKPICIPWQDIEAAEGAVFRRPVVEYRIANLSGYSICLPLHLARAVEEECRHLLLDPQEGSSAGGPRADSIAMERRAHDQSGTGERR